MNRKLTKKTLDSLIASTDPSADKIVWDGEVPGFVVRLKGGRASFAFQYKSRGKTKRMTIGKYGGLTPDQARNIARTLYAQTKAGVDPVESKNAERVRQTTFAEVAGQYLADLEQRAAKGATRGKFSTLAEWQRLLNSRILPAIGSLEAVKVELEHVEAMHRKLSATPAQANRALTVVSAILGFAEKKRIRPLGSNPCRLVVTLKERAHNSHLTLPDLSRLGQALREAEAGRESSAALLAIRLIALTGLRRSEVLGHGHKPRRTEGSGLRWRDVDLDSRCLVLRDAKAGARTVPLGDAAVRLLRAAKHSDDDPDDFVCPGGIAGQPYIGIDKVRRRLFKSAGIPAATLHSLRHTFSSVAANAGLGEYIVAGLLGHRSGSITSHYVHPDRDPLHQAAEVVCGRIAAALGD